MKPRIIISILFFIVAFVFLSCNGPEYGTKECTGIITCHTSFVTENDIEIKKAYDAVLLNQDFVKAESIISALMNDAKIKRDRIRQLKYLTTYFLIPDLAFFSKLTTEYTALADELLFEDFSIQEIWNLTYSLFNYYYYKKDEKLSLSFASKLQDLAVKNSEEGTTALAYLAAGKANELNQRYKLAIRNLFNALTHANRSSRKDILIMVNSTISDFYSGHKMIDNALEYKSVELALREPKTFYDSLEYFHSELFYHDLISTLYPEQLFDTSRIFYIVDFAKMKGAGRLLNYTTAFLRTNLVKSNRIKELSSYYNGRGIDELEELKDKNASIFYSIQAFKSEYEKNIANADDYFRRAIDVLDEDKAHPARVSIVNLNYGEFLERIGLTEQSKKYYYKALEYAEISNDTDFKLLTYKRLSDYLIRINDYKDALKFKEKYHSLYDKQYYSLNSQDIFKIETETEQKILEEKLRREEELKKRLIDSQYNLIAVFCIVFFILFLILVRYNIPIWFIRVLGFISIILIFEYIIIQMDYFIKDGLKDSPWLLFGIKVVIISIMLPLHHLVERKLVRFLIHKRESGEPWIKLNFELFRQWFKKLDSPEDHDH